MASLMIPIEIHGLSSSTQPMFVETIYYIIRDLCEEFIISSSFSTRSLIFGDHVVEVSYQRNTY